MKEEGIKVNYVHEKNLSSIVRELSASTKAYMLQAKFSDQAHNCQVDVMLPAASEFTSNVSPTETETKRLELQNEWLKFV